MKAFFLFISYYFYDKMNIRIKNIYYGGDNMYGFSKHLFEGEKILYQARPVPNKGNKNIHD